MGRERALLGRDTKALEPDIDPPGKRAQRLDIAGEPDPDDARDTAVAESPDAAEIEAKRGRRRYRLREGSLDRRSQRRRRLANELEREVDAFRPDPAQPYRPKPLPQLVLEVTQGSEPSFWQLDCYEKADGLLVLLRHGLRPARASWQRFRRGPRRSPRG